jgi:PPOX class probable F420-dependent enzyme
MIATSVTREEDALPRADHRAAGRPEAGFGAPGRIRVLTKRSFDNAGFAMTPGEVMAFFAERPRYATVITLRRDGAPIGDGVSFEWDGDALYFSVRSHRPIVRRLARDARTCVHVMNAEYPVRWVRMEGSAESVEDPGYERSLRMMRRYMAPESPLQTLPGFDLAAFEADYTAAGRTVYRVRPHTVQSSDTRKLYAETR